MDESVSRAVSKIGAKLVVEEPPRRLPGRGVRRWVGVGTDPINPRFRSPEVIPAPRFNIRDNGKKDAKIVITQDTRDDTEIVVLDVDAESKHMVLMTRKPRGNGLRGEEKHRMLIGFDEREYFIAGVPEATPITTVKDAKAALKPDAVRHTEARTGVLRQGEWFFMPRPEVALDERYVLSNEPLTRGSGSKPHLCQELARYGGTLVYVGLGRFRSGLTEEQYKALPEKDRDRHKPWRTMMRDPKVFVRGWVRHKDHATLILKGWHEVVMNTEAQSEMGKHITFLD